MEFVLRSKKESGCCTVQQQTMSKIPKPNTSRMSAFLRHALYLRHYRLERCAFGLYSEFMLGVEFGDESVFFGLEYCLGQFLRYMRLPI
jgi:hypothetical protein